MYIALQNYGEGDSQTPPGRNLFNNVKNTFVIRCLATKYYIHGFPVVTKSTTLSPFIKFDSVKAIS
jgi:hypothetical protein